MNKVFVSNVVSRYSNKVVKDVSSNLPKSPASSYTWNEAVQKHLDDLRIIFEKFRHNNLILNLSKSEFFQREISALGFRLAENKLLLPSSISESLARLETPRSVKEVQAFLGWAGYYRRFIANFSTIAAPLTALCGVRVPFI